MTKLLKNFIRYIRFYWISIKDTFRIRNMTDTLRQFAYYNFPIWYILQGQQDPDEFLIKSEQWYSDLSFEQAKEILEWLKNKNYNVQY